MPSKMILKPPKGRRLRKKQALKININNEQHPTRIPDMGLYITIKTQGLDTKERFKKNENLNNLRFLNNK